ncbi:MAG: hypothetical protein HYX96_08345 [Chloroflexi bacterium]|nr:hypothetical protein [Chloroflexota bacterium]
MARMVSPAGDMEVSLSRLSRCGNQFVITGQIGIWDSDIYFTPEETMRVALRMLRLSLLAYFAALPFVVLYRRLFRKGTGA